MKISLALRTFTLMIAASITCSLSFAGQYDLGIYNEQSLSNDKCQNFRTDDHSCWSISSDSSEMQFVSTQVATEMRKRLNEDFSVSNANTGGGQAHIITEARNNEHGLMLNLNVFPVKILGQWKLRLSGNVLNSISGKQLGNHEVTYALPEGLDCDDDNATYGIKEECFKTFYAKAAEELSFALTTQLNLNTLDERTQFTDINAIAATIGQAPEEDNTSNTVVDNTRFSARMKDFSFSGISDLVNDFSNYQNVGR
tara:strand:+ start:110 stop:874 length:765 start_codon:yes stop_codon:yes gene_type:complete